MTITILNALPNEAWHQYVQQHPAGGIFNSPEMFELFARIDKHQPSLWAAVDDREQILALFTPVQLWLKGGLMRRVTTRAVSYSNILHTPTPQGKAALSLLLQNYNQRVSPDVLFTEIRHLADMRAIYPTLQRANFTHDGHLNYLVDLQGTVDDVVQNMGRRTRKQIRRALRKEEIVVRQGETLTDMRICYELIKQSYQAAQIYLADFALFQTAFELLYPRGMLTVWLAYVKNTCVAASVELPYKKTLYGWYGGVDRDYSRQYPGEVLMWHVFAWAIKNGYTLYDFGGAGHPDEEYGVRDFKAKFGGTLVNFGRDMQVHRPLTLQASRGGYELYRRWVLG